MVMVLVSAAAAVQVNRAARQRAAVAWVERNGGFVRYDFEVRGTSEPASPPWLVQLLGRDYLARVVHVYLSGPEVDDAVWAALARLPWLKLVVLEGTSVTPAAAARFRRANPGCTVSGS